MEYTQGDIDIIVERNRSATEGARQVHEHNVRIAHKRGDKIARALHWLCCAIEQGCAEDWRPQIAEACERAGVENPIKPPETENAE